MSGKTNSVIVWYKMLWTTIFLFPIFYLIKDLMKLFWYIGEIRPIFTSIILCGCRVWVQHLSYFGYKNLVVTSPFWVWWPLGLASMQLPVFSWISVFHSILHAFVNYADLLEFHSSATARNITSPELRHLHYTNWRLKICIWRLYFSSLSRKGDLRIFLISSPV